MNVNGIIVTKSKIQEYKGSDTSTPAFERRPKMIKSRSNSDLSQSKVYQSNSAGRSGQSEDRPRDSYFLVPTTLATEPGQLEGSIAKSKNSSLERSNGNVYNDTFMPQHLKKAIVSVHQPRL